VPADGAKMHEVAITSAGACVLLILSACGFTEVGDGGELAHNWPPSIVPAHQTLPPEPRKSASRRWIIHTALLACQRPLNGLQQKDSLILEYECRGG
jgi:hypothetical protein